MILGKQAWPRIQHSHIDSENLPRGVLYLAKEEHEMSSLIGKATRE